MLKLKPDVCENGGDSHSDDEGIQFVNKGDNQDNIGIGQGVGTIQWFTEEGNIYITIKDRDGVCEKETIPVQKITNFKSFMEENHEDLSMFDRLNRDFNMSPDEISNPFVISSRYPLPNKMPTQQQKKRPGLGHQKSFKSNKNRKKQTPHKRKKSPRQRAHTERTKKPYGNTVLTL